MSTRFNYTGGLVTEGLILNLDAAKADSYPGSGTVWKDISGEGNNGTLINGPVYTGVAKDAAFVFDGNLDYVSFPTDKMPAGNSEISFNIWSNWSGNGVNANDFLIGYGNDTGPNSVPLMLIGPTGQMIFEFGSNSGSSATPFGVTSGVWMQACGTYDKSFTKLYLNGSPVASKAYTSASIGASGTNGFNGAIGALFSGFGNVSAGGPRRYGTFNGYIAQAQVYNKALSQFDVFQNFNSLKGRYGIPDIVTDGLVLNLDAGNPYSYLQGSSGTTWTDVSGNGYIGTLTNGASYSNGTINFDGVDDYVKIPSSSQFLFNTGDSITVESWVKCTDIDATAHQSFFTIGGNPSVDRDRLIQMRVSQYTNYGYVDMLHRNSANTQWHIYRTSNIVVTENEWIHIVGTLTYGNGSTWKIYINGNLATSEFRPGENGNADPIQPSDTSIYLGPEDGSIGSEYFTGNISVSRLYQKALSATEITQNFNALKGRYGVA